MLAIICLMHRFSILVALLETVLGKNKGIHGCMFHRNNCSELNYSGTSL